MASWVNLRLDTTAPHLEGSLTEDTNTMISTIALTTDDAVEMRVWGDIDVTWPGNADLAEAEGDAPWITYADITQIRLTGAKRIFVRARDDAWNETAALPLQIGATPTPEVRPPDGGLPGRRTPKRQKTEVRTVVSISEIRLGTGWSETTTQSTTSTMRFLQTSAGGLEAPRTLNSSSSPFAIKTGYRLTGSGARSSTLKLDASTTVAKRSEGPETQAVLIELDLL